MKWVGKSEVEDGNGWNRYRMKYSMQRSCHEQRVKIARRGKPAKNLYSRCPSGCLHCLVRSMITSCIIIWIIMLRQVRVSKSQVFHLRLRTVGNPDASSFLISLTLGLIWGSATAQASQMQNVKIIKLGKTWAIAKSSNYIYIYQYIFIVFLSLSTYHLLVPLHWECIEGKVSSNRRARRDTNQINAKCSGHRECVKSVTMTGWVLGIIWVFGAFDTRFQRRQHQQHCYHKHYSLLADHSELARQVHSCLKSAVFVVLLFVLFVHREGSFLQHPTATLTDWLELFVVMGDCCRLSEVNMASAGNSNHLNFINSDYNEDKHDKKCFLELLCAACVCLRSMSVLQSCT